jgi:hypothetical protein
MNLGTSFNRRHPRTVIIIRVLVTAWLLALTGILLATGLWGWALLTEASLRQQAGTAPYRSQAIVPAISATGSLGR